MVIIIIIIIAVCSSLEHSQKKICRGEIITDMESHVN
jgi:hypothetical protein